MYRVSIFKWISLSLLAASTILFLLGLKNHDAVRAASDDPASTTQGSLLAMDSSGKPAGECPLKHTSVKAEISGFLSRVTVTQEFENPFAEKIEAVYTFPLPQAAAVDDMTMRVGERTVKGKIMRREQARAAYTAAKTSGRVAGLLDQERPNIFTQSVANIMPGERVTVTISYVETLKYEDGSYEFVFPMVVGPRYTPSDDADGTQSPGEQQQEDAATTGGAPDAALVASPITSPVMPPGTRAGHDIYIEIALDAGVPVSVLDSPTHEIELERPDEARAVVRLRDRATIPNKDFVLKYVVAGRQIEDAVLAHRSGTDGFFTLILQPPARVTAEDVTAKELVFVLDTSGSMSGFPIEKAKETMKLALDHLYPQDTFNLITFSGDTAILFDEPVPATPENLRKAQKFLASQHGDGGTEMMKAIRAALDPSDAQGHLRIACFMTDGQVGNDEEIISEVRKHANARVFAMGFGSSPNRHLLDKMSEYGRGEVEYLTETEDGSAAARRVFERIRSPLLTDISIDWNGLKVSDVYPRRIPDLFSARPVILSGRYSEGGRGTILLRGRMSGRDTVREIPVELPETETEHDVLATLWARRRIDDLLSQDQYTGYTNQMTDDVREAITRLGLQYRLMTQFTSFVAVEDRVVTDTGEPQRVYVPAETPAAAAGSVSGATQGAIPSGVMATVDITGTASMVEINSTSQELNGTLTATGLRDLPILTRDPYMLAQLSGCATSDSEGSNRATGFSLNGQRAASTNTTLDGVENVDGFGATVDHSLTVDSVQEFRAVTSNFSAEYGRSTSEQFITAERAGTNEYHGSFYGFFLNRQLNSLDTQQKAAGVVRRQNDAPAGSSLMPRYDFFRGGAELGGPVFIPTFSDGLRSGYSGKNRLFFYAAYERLQQGSAAAPSGIKSPTPEGLALLSAIRGLSATNLAVFNFYAPVAPVNNAGTINVNGVDVPIGYVTFAAPSFLKQNNEVARVDFNQSDKTTHNWRLSLADNGGIDTTANLPAFFFDRRIKQRFFSYTTTHTFNSQLVNETRLAYRRVVVDTPAPNIPFPGLDAFPNIRLADLGIDLGPNPFAPQTGVENDYRIGDQLSYAAGNHTLRLGGDFRKRISRQRFVRRERGEYEYSSADLFLRDLSPDLFGERSFGGTTYHGDQKILNAFFQDEWRVRPNVTLNLGLSHSYQAMPAGTRLQALNATASAPGLIEFRAPQTDGNNFAPKLGLAYSPNFKRGLMARLFGGNDESVIRAGFTMGYDYVFDNIYAGANPPQTSQTVDVPSLTTQTRSFIADGAITNSPKPIGGDAAAARLATSSYVPDQQVPYSLVWTLSFERRFKTDWAVELRYMGTRGVHLLTQSRLNRIGKVGAQGRAGLPTFFNAPAQAELDGLRTRLTLADILARSNYEPRFDAAGFNGANVVAFLSNGTSTYHGGSVRLLRRFTGGSFVYADYIWSHLIDDVPAGVNAPVLGPSRAEEFQERGRERADSALDHRHRFSLSSVYELPFFRNSTNRWAGLLLGGFNFSGRWTLESGAKATVLSGLDSNLNADAEGDRTIRNPFGVRNTASIVTPLLATCAAVNADGTCAESEAARTVGYLAVDPRAEYIQAGAGVISNSARNTLGLPGVHNLNFSIFKNFWFGEVRRIQLRADFFNLFNHPQYVEGSLQGVTPISYTTFRNINRVGALEFNRPDLAFSSNPRVIQLSLRFNF